MLRWLVQREVVALAKSVRKEPMQENLAVFDFALDTSGRDRIATLETGQGSFFSHRAPGMGQLDERAAARNLRMLARAKP